MTQLPWPTSESQLSFLNNSLETIGRDVSLFYVASVSGCSVCSLDPVSNTSTDAFCVVCSGLYWIETLNEYVTKAHITWKSSDELSWYSAGKQMDGDCQIRLNLASGIENIVDSTRYVLVDDKTMQVRKSVLRGAPEVNRILITLLEKEK